MINKLNKPQCRLIRTLMVRLIKWNYSKLLNKFQVVHNKVMASRDIVNKVMASRDMVNKDMVNKDMVSRDMVNKDMVSRDMVNKDMVNKGMANKGMVNRVMGSKDMVSRDMDNKAMVNKVTGNKQVMDNRALASKTSKELGGKDNKANRITVNKEVGVNKVIANKGNKMVGANKNGEFLIFLKYPYIKFKIIFKFRFTNQLNHIIQDKGMMQDISNLLFHDKPSKRAKWFKIFQDPIWKPLFEAPLSAHRDLAYKQLKKVADSGVVSVLNFIDDPTNIFTSHEMLGTVSSSTTTKFTVHYNLFGGSIVALHTDRHKDIFQKIDSLQITGCFCLTELGYGNNAVQMETTATYDQKTKQFTINSPTTLSQKYWITNGAVHANMAVVFAQTIVKGKNQGINAFLVPIRDKNLKSFEGVQIREMGIKIGLNGVDNAALLFHNVKIPRVNMMNKYSDVTQNGDFISDIKGIQQRFFKVTQRLLSGRLCIASMTMGALKRTIYTTVKYSKQRYGVSPNGKSQTPIFEYQLQKNALIPIIARMLGLNMLHNYAKQVYANPQDRQHDLLMICCVDKTLVGWHSQRGIAIMRQRCGGQGFLGANMFGQAIAGSHAALTAEGDNRVLMIKVAKDMLAIFAKNNEAYYNGQFIKFEKIQNLKDLNHLVTLFQMKHKHHLLALIQKMLKLKGKGISNYDILMFNVSDQIQEVSQAYGEMLAIKHCVKSLQKLNQGRQIMRKFFVLFGLEIVLRDLSLLLLNNWICPEVAKNLHEEYNILIKQAAVHIDTIIQSLNIPVKAIYSPIAKNYVLYNQKSYEGEVINAKM